MDSKRIGLILSTFILILMFVIGHQWQSDIEVRDNHIILLQSQLVRKENDLIQKDLDTRTLDINKQETIKQQQAIIIQLRNELSRTHNIYLTNIEEIDKVNSDFQSYGDSRFREGHIRIIYISCLRQLPLVDYCAGQATQAYQLEIWEDDAPAWDDVWRIIRGLVTDDFF